MATATKESLDFFKSGLEHSVSLKDVAERAAGLVCELFRANRVCVAYLDTEAQLETVIHGDNSRFPYRSQLSLESGRIKRDGRPLAVPLFISDQTHAELREAYLALIGTPGTRALGIVPLYVKGTLSGWIECHFFDRRSQWREDDCFVLRQCADIMSLAMQAIAQSARVQEPAVRPRRASFSQTVRDQVSLDVTPWLMMDLDASGTVLQGSKGDGAFPFIAVQDIKGKSIHDVMRSLVQLEDQQRLLGDINNIQKGLLPRLERVISLALDKKTAVPVLIQIETGLPDENYITIVMSDLSESLKVQEKLQEARLQSMRLINYGQMLVIRTDAAFNISDVVGNARQFLGVAKEELLWKQDFWPTLVEEEDLRALRKTVREMEERYTGFTEEIRITHAEDQTTRWLLLNTAPLYSRDGSFLGWEAVVVDVTDRRQAEQELLNQQRRLEALYDVSRALEGDMDPAFVALRGLKALIAATSCSGGLATFYDPQHDQLDVVAAQGLTTEYIEEISQVMRGKNLLRLVIENRSGLLIDDIQQDSRAAVALARKEGLRSSILMPLLYDDEDGNSRVLGSFVLFSRRRGKFSQDDFDLVAAASRQLALVLRQAEYYAAEKQNASSVKALYRLSHELSRLFTPREVAAHALPILEEELGCRRIWMGVVNEAGTHIVGQGALGPGMSATIAELQIELATRHDYLDEALESGKPTIIPMEAEMQCGGLQTLLNRLHPQSLIVVPLVSLGQSVGVLVVEPWIEMQRFLKQRLHLLSSMASEMATVIVARRFESRMAGAEKMRMAGLFASGVAHNFNNMLQAIMGQASLMDMQIAESSPLKDSTAFITDVATRGAELINQLLLMTRRDTRRVERFDIREVLNSSAELYRSVIGSIHELRIEDGDEVLDIQADKGQIQQIFSHLIMNARDALHRDKPGLVRIRMRQLKVTTGEVHPELSPGQYVCVEIQDNGVGMTREASLRCFEPFFTTKNVDRDTGLAFDGSGLGLSVAYSIVREYNGLIVIESQAGEGTNVCTYLPLAVPLSASDDARDEGPQVHREQVALLNVSSHERKVANEVFDSVGLGTVEFTSSIDVLTAVHRKQPLTLILGNLDGTECDVEAFVQQIQKKQSGLSCIFITERTAYWERKLMHYPRVSVIAAPLNTMTIRKVVQKVVRGPLVNSIEVQETADESTTINPYEHVRHTRKERRSDSEEV